MRPVRATATILLALVLAALVLAACDLPGAILGKKTPPQRPAQTPTPRIEATLALSGGDGRVHVIAMPSAYLEVTRCLVAVGPNGQAVVSCAPKDLDVPPPPEQ